MKKTDKANAGKADTPETSNPASDPAQQRIWLAGLGAFAKAGEEGGRMFEALVKEGIARQRKTQAEAQQKLSEATQRIGAFASGLSAQAARPWGGLENIFEDRVAKALNALGVPSSRDMDALAVRLDALHRRAQSGLLASIRHGQRRLHRPRRRPRGAHIAAPLHRPCTVLAHPRLAALQQFLPAPPPTLLIVRALRSASATEAVARTGNNQHTHGEEAATPHRGAHSRGHAGAVQPIRRG